MKRHNNIFILKSLFWHIQSRSVFTFRIFLEESDLIKICNSSWGKKISGFHQNIISQKKVGLTTRWQWEFVATKNLIFLASRHPFVNLRWIYKGQDQQVKCAGRVPTLPEGLEREQWKTRHFETNVFIALEEDEAFPVSDPVLLQIHTDLQQPLATPWAAAGHVECQIDAANQKWGSAHTTHPTPAPAANGTSPDGLQHILQALGPLSIMNGEEKLLFTALVWHCNFIWGHLFLSLPWVCQQRLEHSSKTLTLEQKSRNLFVFWPGNWIKSQH